VTRVLPSKGTNPESNIVVYADGWRDASRRTRPATDLGGDDFVEHLHLTETTDGPPLIDVLRTGPAEGYRWLVLRVTEQRVTTRISRTNPALS
jgi:hypothetical protein